MRIRIRWFFEIFSYAKNTLFVCSCLFLEGAKNRAKNSPKRLLEVTQSRKSRNFGTFNFSATAGLPYGLPPLLANALSGRKKRVGWHPTLSREEIL